jgi:hypothetical protein
VTFDYEQHATNFEHRGQIPKDAGFIGKVMQRVMLQHCVKLVSCIDNLKQISVPQPAFALIVNVNAWLCPSLSGDALRRNSAKTSRFISAP